MWQKIKNSIYNPAYYQEVIKDSKKSAFGYYYTLAAIISLLATIFISIIFLPKIIPFVRGAGEQIVNNFPADLVINIKDGKASINQPEPYKIPIPSNWINQFGQSTSTISLENLLVIDTKTPFTPAQFESYRTMALLKEDAVYYYSKYQQGGNALNTQQSFSTLQGVPNVQINRQLIEGLIGKVIPMAKIIVPFLMPIIFIIFLVVFSLQLLYLFVAALLVWLLSKPKGVALTYGQAYRVSLHAITLPVIIFYLLWPVRFVLPPYTFTIILLVMAYINLPKGNPKPVIDNNS